ncbi:MAG: type II secretion system F family protein [Lentisphaerae bacterium]|nr:type II secretion system F family protein [Lentisphaerota bacterium]
MPNYDYKATDDQGRTVSGSLEAPDASEARHALAARGLIPLSVMPAPVSAGAQLRLARKVKPQDMVLFTKQLGTMLGAGVPAVRALDILESQSEHPTLRSAVTAMARDVRTGANLSTAMRKHPHVFSELYTGMIHAGETSGALVQVMDRLIYVIEHEAKVKSDVRAALQYPLLVLICLSAAFFVLITFVVPKFAVAFSRSGVPLPLPTRICLGIHSVVSGHWQLVLAMIAVVAVSAVALVKTRPGRHAVDKVTMSLPIIGPLVRKAAISRFASIFAILQSTGVAVLDSMVILQRTIGNAVMQRNLERVQVLLKEGHGIAGPLKECGVFTPMLVNMVAIGEESGNLDTMLREISRHYDSEVEYATKKLSDTLGPVLIIAMAALVGFFALAVYMPMWDLARIAIRQ